MVHQLTKISLPPFGSWLPRLKVEIVPSFTIPVMEVVL